MKFFWTYERIKEEALKHKSRIEFKRNSRGAYAAAQSTGVLDEVCKHMKFLRRRSYSIQELRAIALQYSSRGEFQQKNGPAYGAALNKKILNELCIHMKPSATTAYTYEEICEEAKKFKTRKDFQLGSPAYKAAWRRGILDAICSHMPKHADQSGKNNGSFKWGNNEIYEKALKYNTRSEFKFGSPKEYDVAIQRKIIDSVCSHMKLGSNVSLPEKELFNIIKNIYPSTTTYRRRNVDIVLKPHITGLYLDIYLPELKKAVEFDGTYWHSEKGLRKTKPHWPDEDILNYHKIKDDWFASKGIQVLHIKEEDWINNKEAQISMCLDFLKK